jgi:hypothetical protein
MAYQTRRADASFDHAVRGRHELDYGALVGVVEVVGCVPLAEVEGDPFALGPWCWILRRPRRIRHVSWKGQVGFFDVPARLLRATCRTARIDPGTSSLTERPTNH